MFGWSDWGHIHTKADSPGAGTKIIPDRISVHISNGDFDAISVTERSCAHASPSIKWIFSHKVVQIFLKVSPKFFKNLRRVTFKCTASLKWHFFLLQLNFLWRKPSQTESFFSLDYPRFEINGLEIEPLFSKWRQTSEFSALNNNDHLLVQVFSCCARVVFIQGGEVRCFSPFWKAWFYFQTIELKPRVVHLKKGVVHRVKFSRCYLLSLTSKHWNFLF